MSRLAAVTPLENRTLEALELLCLPDVCLQAVDVASKRAIDTVPRQQDSAGQAQLFAQSALPKTHRLRVSNRGKLIKEDNFLHLSTIIQ